MLVPVDYNALVANAVGSPEIIDGAVIYLDDGKPYVDIYVCNSNPKNTNA